MDEYQEQLPGAILPEPPAGSSEEGGR